ncbi:LacI family DNA-binding transcriptional regulator [Dietzia maris]|uniref:LacI family DNA-binding transcriptional regulator n=1 Tax=Dietzia maris TaxID=37915 RepID=UPI00344F3832
MDESRPARVGIREVAARAGVSTATVSLALNGTGRISDLTRARVRRAAEELGYRPAPGAAALRSGKSGLVAIVDRVPHHSTWRWTDLEFTVRLTHAICGAVWARGLYPVLLPADAIDFPLAGLPVDGAVVIDPVPSDPLLTGLERSGVPTVTMGRDLDHPTRTVWADNDKYEQCRIVLNLFAETGARRPLLLVASSGQSYMHDNAVAFRELTGGRGTVLEVPPSISAEECRRLVRSACTSPDAIDAIYILVEALVQPTVQAIEELGLLIPREIQVVTSSDSAVSRNGAPPLTSFDLHPERLGEELVAMMVRRLDPGPDANRTVPATLLRRASTRIPGH